jgi:hypothetical protein
MTLAEVEQLLGGPARDESTGPLAGDADGKVYADDREQPVDSDTGTLMLSVMREMAALTFKLGRRPDGNLFWVSDQVFIQVVFDEDDRVFGVATISARRADESPLDVIRRYLRL